MSTRVVLCICLLPILVLLKLPPTALGQVPLGTAFTYQGRLANSGNSVSGLHDLRFTLYDAPIGGAQLGASTCFNNVGVTDGLVTVALDFGAHFAGQERFLEVEVRSDTGLDCANAAGFVLLSPRQVLSGAPNALFALNASTASKAALAANATQLNGQPAAFYQNASNVNSGTLADARLAANIPRLNAANAFGNFSNSFAGSVGIGNTNPLSLLHVGGAYTPTFAGAVARFAGAVAVNGTVASDQGNLLSRSAAGGGAASLVLDSEADLSGATWFINSNSSFSPFGSPGGSLTFDNGAAAMTITSSSNVGIGTSAPARRLHVANGQLGAIAPHANTSLVLERNGNNYLQMYAPDANESGLLFGKPSQDIRAAILADVNDNLQFRAGGNTTRMIIDSSGNVGIGTSASPATRLDVRSTDLGGVRGETAANGSRGVFGWATSTAISSNYGVFGQGDSSNGFGVFAIGTLGASGTKAFRIDHPDDPANKYLLHYAAESPDVINFYSETVMLDERGGARVTLPHYFAKINTRPRYQLTAVGAPMPMLHVAEKISESALDAGARAGPDEVAPPCSFRIAGGAPGAEVSWEVKAVRNDHWVRKRGAPVEVEKQYLERGTYQHPELYGQPEERGLNYKPDRVRASGPPASETEVD